jgi:hypothetical protein
MPSHLSFTRSTSAASVTVCSALLEAVTPSLRRVEYPVDLARINVSFLSALKNCCLVIEHFPNSSRHSLFEQRWSVGVPQPARDGGPTRRETTETLPHSNLGCLSSVLSRSTAKVTQVQVG